jgi:hypothetical protein
VRNKYTIDHINELIHKKFLTIREITDDLNNSCGICQAMLTHDHGMKCILAEFVPQLLEDDQQGCCNIPKMMPPSCQALLQVIKHGSVTANL